MDSGEMSMPGTTLQSKMFPCPDRHNIRFGHSHSRMCVSSTHWVAISIDKYRNMLRISIIPIKYSPAAHISNWYGFQSYAGTHTHTHTCRQKQRQQQQQCRKIVKQNTHIKWNIIAIRWPFSLSGLVSVQETVGTVSRIRRKLKYTRPIKSFGKMWK